MSLPFPFLSLQFAVPEDTPELAAFLYNSTISHYIRRRDVAVAESHRKNSAKILVSCLNAIYWDCAGNGEILYSTTGKANGTGHCIFNNPDNAEAIAMLSLLGK